MTIEEFLDKFDEEYGAKYEYEWDDISNQIIILSDTTGNSHFYGIKIDLNDEMLCVYKDFLYEDCYGVMAELSVGKEQLLFTEALKRFAGAEVQCEYEDGFGCPFYSELVGFFQKPLSWETFASMIGHIEQACYNMNTISITDMDKHSSDYISYMKSVNSAFQKLKEVSPSLCAVNVHDTNMNSSQQLNDVMAYVNADGTAMCGIGLEALNILNTNPASSDCQIYKGFDYFIIRSNEASAQMVITKQQLVNQFSDMVYRACTLEEFEVPIQHYIGAKGQLIIVCGEIWGIISPISNAYHNNCLISEKNRIKSMERDFIAIAPKELWEQAYDFSKLTDERFECLCRDMLCAMNFKDVTVRGKTRAADGGVDIIATEEYRTLIGTEKRKWIFQCKHMKAQVGRKDLSEVRDLLNEFEADCYGLFYSDYLTPNTQDRIDTICKNDNLIIKCWDHNSIEIFLMEHSNLSLRYFGL